MEVEENKIEPLFESELKKDDYAFIFKEPRIGENLMFLCIGGSYSYGLQNENSDIDFRGVTFNTMDDLLGISEFEQYVSDKTDTVVYGFNKFIKLLIKGSPNAIEMLGCKHEHYICASLFGNDTLSLLINHRDYFISKHLIKSYGGYIKGQIHRLESGKTNNIHGDIKTQERLNKYGMHIFRLYDTLFDILKTGDIKTYREEDHDFLMSVRNGIFNREDGQLGFNKEFYSLINKNEETLSKLASETSIPDNIDAVKVNELAVFINHQVVELRWNEGKWMT